MREGLYLNERNGDLVELTTASYNQQVIVGKYLCPISNEECETEFEYSFELTKLIFIGEV